MRKKNSKRSEVLPVQGGEIQKWFTVLRELWLTASCRALAEDYGAAFEIEATREAEWPRSLAVCSEFRIAGGFAGQLAFGIPTTSREVTALLLLGKNNESEEKTWDDFSANTAQRWAELVQAETGLVCTITQLQRGVEHNTMLKASTGLFSTLKSDKITLPVYLRAEMEEAPTSRTGSEPDTSGQRPGDDSAGKSDSIDSSGANLDLLLDIELQASLRFGGREMPLSEILHLGPGDVVPLDRPVQAPVDLVVGDRIVARGEVVLVDGNYGLRVTEVAEPRKRLETVRCLF